ncbi:MAG TPA: hypothetical protein ENK59_08580 [Thioploca sp.]|nr:hypothetical protein [Thioploca sp.]
MIENGLIKVGGAKIFGVALLPGITLLALGGIITWNFWKSSNEKNYVKGTLKDFKIEIDRLTNEKQELLSQISKLKEDFLELKKITLDRFINNIPIHNKSSDSSLDNLIIKKQELSLQVSKLQEKFNQLQTAMSGNISSVANEKFKSTSDSPKLDMLKWVIEDNVKLRKSI